MRFQELEDGLRVLAPAKLNLHLEVGPRREDGFHDIDSIFQAVTLFDELEFRPGGAGDIVLAGDGAELGERNLVVRAARELQAWAAAHGRSGLGASVRVKKRIPQGAGLGGGSSDAAASLLALTRLWALKPDVAALTEMAAAVGSDVPFFLSGGTARCRGRGEHVTPLDSFFETAPPLYYVLAYPRVEVATAWVYEKLDASREEANGLTASTALDSISPTSLRSQLGCGRLFFNRFEEVVFSAFPELQALHDKLAQEPFLAVLLSGSGSTVYGACTSAEQAEKSAAVLCAEVEADVYVVRSERRVSSGLAGS